MLALAHLHRPPLQLAHSAADADVDGRGSLLLFILLHLALFEAIVVLGSPISEALNAELERPFN
jgi:hypothetical protein